MRQAASDSSAVLPIRSLNHVSRVCRDVKAAGEFYQQVLGFIPIARPSFQFDGAWCAPGRCFWETAADKDLPRLLFNFGVGIHLIQGEPTPRPSKIDPKADHLSFQSDSLKLVEDRLHSLGVPFVKDVVVENGLRITQIFLHDPDNNMIEICNCDCLPIRPLAACTAPLSMQQRVDRPAGGQVSGVQIATDCSFASRRPVYADSAA